MLKNYLKIAFRNIRRFKLYSVINIAGLAVGMAVFILIMQFVRFQLSFDNFNEKADRIYRVVFKGLTAGGSQQAAVTPELLAPALKEEFPQIESAVRIEKDYPAPLVSCGAKRFYEDKFLLADSTFFRVFTFKFLEGNSRSALSNLNSVVITHSVAEKYFGLEDPIGKIITVDNGFQKRELTVTGVIED
ncbi:MAG: ABC transporter permease, partial [Bacteroidetes bacterium]|nr:ABC transporter permease [Bacteroidota bacterium]